MIWRLKIELLLDMYIRDEEEWIRIIEIDCSTTLEELHYIIQDLVDFDDDHLYEFYIARTARSRDRIRFDDENGEVFDLSLEDLFPLEKARKLFYLFDYGDHWLFSISKTRHKPKQPEKGGKYPRLIEKIGKNPEQYPHWED